MVLVIVSTQYFALGDSSGGAPEATSFSVAGGGGDPGYTGRMAQSFPLMTIPGRGMDYPLAMSYSASNRLEDEASWIGLGFDLGSGVIIRNVRGIPDGYKASQGQNHGGGWLNENSCFNGCYDQGKLCDCGDQDYYSVSFPGGSGQLISQDKTNWFMDNWNTYKITSLKGAGNDIEKWTITTSDGTNYTFSQAVTRSISSPELKKFKCAVNSGSFTTEPSDTKNREETPYVYAWYLTQILSADYSDTTGDGPTNDDKGSWVRLRYNVIGPFGYEYPNVIGNMRPTSGEYIGAPETHEFAFQGIAEKGATNEVYIFYRRFIANYQEAYISSIETPTHTATFTTASRLDKKDTFGNSNSKRLSTIVLTNKQSPETILQKVEFSNNYYDLAKGADGDYSKGRLTLRQFQLFGKDNVPLPPTTFTYYRPDRLYYRFADDWFGYYNGISPDQEILTCQQYYGDSDLCIKTRGPPNQPITLQNNGYNVQGICTQIAGGNAFDFYSYLLPHEGGGEDEHEVCIAGGATDDRSIAWVLHYVQFPTGGKVTYEYECNKYNYDSDKKNLLMNQYGAAADCYQNPDTCYLKKGGLRLKSVTTDDGLGNTVATNYQYETGAATLDQSAFTLSQTWPAKEMRSDSIYIEYPKMTKSVSGYGKTVTEYTTIKSGNQYLDGIINYGQDIWCKPTIGISYRVKRGTPYHSAVYAQNNPTIPIAEQTYSQFNFPEKNQYAEGNLGGVNYDSSNLGDCNYNYAFKSIWPYFTQSTSMQDGMITTQSYDYIPETGQMRKSTMTNSDNKQKVDYVTYAWEYDTAPEDPQYQIYLAMKNKNMLSYQRVAATGSNPAGFSGIIPTAWTNVLGASKTNYQEKPSGSGNYYPYQTYAWEDAGTPPNNQIGDTEWKLQSQINEIDVYGRATEVQDSTGIKTKTFYGPNDGCSNTGGAYPTCIQQCKDASCSSSFTSTSSYGIMGNVEKQTDPNNAVTRYLYDKLWRLTKAFLPGDTYHTAQACTTPGWSTCYEYVYGIETGPAGLNYDPTDFDPLDLNYVHTYTRIETGKNMEAWSYADGLGKDYVGKTLDAQSRPVVTEKEFNAIGLPEKQSEPILMTTLPADRKKTHTEYETSPLMRQKKVYPLGEYPSGVYSEFAYSGEPNYHYTTITDAKGIRTRSKTDKLGRTVEVKAALGTTDEVTTTTTYNDVAGQSITVRNPSNQVTETRADTLGRARVTKHPDFG
ncbi:MAG: hypothetical protein ABIJ21_09290, partial [Nanoarchaeota archaeon]